MEFRSATAISGALHAAVLLWALISFSGQRLEATPAESLPVDFISDKDFSQLTKGVKDAPKLEMPKPVVEKVADAKPVEDLAPKLTEKQEVKPTQQKTSAPAESKPDPIAEKIKKLEEQKQETKAEPVKKPAPSQRQQPRFDPNKIAALLDKRDPQRQAATGAIMNSSPALGAASGTAAQLSQSEIDALRERLRQCWNPPVGATNANKLSVVFRVMFKRDGSLQNNPVLVGGSASEFGPALAESATRALLQCQPYTMLRPEHYDTWKDMQITFDPRDMFGG
jgi:outer membrane biosynthesis protein TonB